jgi:hypothetical protein
MIAAEVAPPVVVARMRWPSERWRRLGLAQGLRKMSIKARPIGVSTNRGKRAARAIHSPSG